MAELLAYFQTASGGPLTGPAGANIPEILIVRTPADTVAQAAIDMVELVNAPGWYQFTFAPVDGEQYAWTADGDPAAILQIPATGRYVRGVVSGTQDARIEVDVPLILADTAAIEPLATTNLDATVSSRGTADPGDAMDLVANAVDSAAIATDAITADSIAAAAITATEAPNLDAAVSSRSSHSAADVDTVLSAAHGSGAWTGRSTSR